MNANTRARTIRSRRHEALKALILATGVVHRFSSNGEIHVHHPFGLNHGYLALRVSDAGGGFARARAYGAWPSPLEPGRMLWSVPVTETEVADVVVTYARTGGRVDKE